MIATVTYTSSISPLRGVYQEGPLKRKSSVGRAMAFKVFQISNNIVLFTFLSIVIILPSIIPFKRKELTKLLVIMQKPVWVSMSFIATGFVAAMRISVLDGQGSTWVTDSLLAIGDGTLGFLFVYLGVVFTRDWLRKLKRRAKKLRKQSKAGVINGRIKSSSTNIKLRIDLNQNPQTLTSYFHQLLGVTPLQEN